jgi:SNF2 family DNA or RNA helicase
MAVRTAEQRGWKLRDYQELSRDYLRERDRGALFLDMGLGKTASCYAALEPRHLPALVVAPKRVAESVWPLEAAIWRPDLTVAVAKGQPAARLRELGREDADVVVIGRDNLRDALKVNRRRKFKTLIIDELSGYKARSSIRWKTAKAIIKRASIGHVWGLTGTPSPNGYGDLWSQIYLLDGGERLGKTLTEYRRRWFTPGLRLPNGVIASWDLVPGAAAQIDKAIEDICLAMGTDGRIELPPVTENHVQIELPMEAKRIYRDMKRDMVANLDILGGEVHTAKNAAVLTSKLSQISAGFLYVDDADIRDRAYTVIHHEKGKAVEEILEADRVGGVLIFYRFVPERDALLKRLGDQAHTIDEPGVIEAWNDGDIPVLLAHPASAGHGLNLQYGGHTIVWTTPDWDLELWQQANKRLARSGQEHPVVIHVIMGGKIDHLVRASLDDKDVVQGALLEHLESPL